MRQHDYLFSDTRSGVTESGTGLDSVIRPCILQAFPLPAPDHAKDETFRLLLDALAQHRIGTG